MDNIAQTNEVKMKVGDLVRHVEIKEAVGIITNVGYREIKVLWNDGDHSWIVSQRMEVTCK